nr:MAG TPA: hypothetical protein [Caudoviricetes sp.]
MMLNRGLYVSSVKAFSSCPACTLLYFSRSFQLSAMACRSPCTYPGNMRPMAPKKSSISAP